MSDRFEVRPSDTSSLVIWDTVTNKRFSVAFFWSEHQAEDICQDINTAYEMGRKDPYELRIGKQENVEEE